jgi:hypothetical protein
MDDDVEDEETWAHDNDGNEEGWMDIIEEASESPSKPFLAAYSGETKVFRAGMRKRLKYTRQLRNKPKGQRRLHKHPHGINANNYYPTAAMTRECISNPAFLMVVLMNLPQFSRKILLCPGQVVHRGLLLY